MEPRSVVLVVVGSAFLIAALAARRLVGFNLLLYRKVGLSRLAVAWEKRLGWWIPTVRLVAATLGLTILALGFGLLPSG